MATRITLDVQKFDEPLAASFLVKEDFDDVIEKIFPTRQAASAMEERGNFVFTEVGGSRIFVHRSTIKFVEENVEVE